MTAIKIYRGTQDNGQTTVTVDGKPLQVSKHRYDNREIAFDWGKLNQGATRLADSILADALGESAKIISNEFVRGVIAELRDKWEITSEDVARWSGHMCHIEHTALQAAMKAEGSTSSNPPPVILNMPRDLPRLMLNPNYRLFPDN